MEEESKYFIAWDKFSSSLSNILSNGRNDSSFSDITLVTDDQQMFHSHRFILAGCSEFFNTILKKCSSSHPYPWLYLNGINSDFLKLLLDFIYLGNVQIEKDSLDEFMQIAKKLKIKGLIDEKRFEQEYDICEDFSDHKNNTNLSENIIGDIKPTFDSMEEDEVNKLTDVISDEQKSIVSDEHKPKQIVTDENLPKPPKIYCYEKITLGNISEVKPKVEELTEKVDGGWRCKFCGFVKKGSGSNKKQELGYHIESHFVGLTYACKICPKTFKTRTSERSHKYRDHKQ